MCVRRCGDGMCVEVGARCDGVAQCADGSDERGCAGASCAALGPAAARCAAAGCYLPAWRCDGYADCADASDEMDCPVNNGEIAITR